MLDAKIKRCNRFNVNLTAIVSEDVFQCNCGRFRIYQLPHCTFQVTSEDDVRAAIDLVKTRFGRLDVNVNCAGIEKGILTYNARQDDPHALEDFARVLQVDLGSSPQLCVHLKRLLNLVFTKTIVS